MSFTREQINALQADLSRSAVRQRTQSGRQFSYIEGWFAEAEANRIFGFDAWHSETVELRMVAENPRKIGQAGVDGWAVSYLAKVRVTVTTPEGRLVVREGVGAGHGIDRDLGLAHESAAKEAETDAEKRALKTFGNPFGLALYDKEQRHVSDSAPPPGPLEDLAATVTPNGRKSSAQAKRDGDDVTIKAEIDKLDKPGLADWMAKFDENTAHLPRGWLDSIRDYAEGHLEELNGRAAVADGEAELEAGFRGALAAGSTSRMARGADHRQGAPA